MTGGGGGFSFLPLEFSSLDFKSSEKFSNERDVNISFDVDVDDGGGGGGGGGWGWGWGWGRTTTGGGGGALPFRRVDGDLEW